MTTMRVWVALDEALKRTGSTSSREIICGEIIRAVNLKIGEGTKFHHYFQDLKKQFLNETQRRSKELWPSSAAKNADYFEKVNQSCATMKSQLRLSFQMKVQRQSAIERSAEATLKLKWIVYSGPAGAAMSSPITIWIQAKHELDLLIECVTDLGPR
jgi:hypothetical protein